MSSAPSDLKITAAAQVEAVALANELILSIIGIIGRSAGGGD